MVKYAGLLKKLPKFLLAGSLALSQVSSNPLFAQQNWLEDFRYVQETTQENNGDRKRSREIFEKEKDYILEGEESPASKGKYHNIESIITDDNLTLTDLEFGRNPLTTGFFNLYDNSVFIDTPDEEKFAGILLTYSGDSRIITNRKRLTIDEAKEKIINYSKDKRHIGERFSDFKRNCGQLREFKIKEIREIDEKEQNLKIKFFDTKVFYEIKNGIITDVKELNEKQYHRANRSEREIISGRIFEKNHPEINFFEYHSASGGTTDGQRFKSNFKSGENTREFKTAFSTAEKDKSKWNLGLSVFKIKNNEQYGKIKEWDAFVKYSPKALYIFENPEFSFMTGMTSTNKNFDATKMNNYTLEQKLKTKSNPLLNFQAFLNSRKQLTDRGEKPFIRFSIADVGGRDQYKWVWFNPDGSFNSRGSTTIPSNYTTISGDLGIKRKNIGASAGRAVNFFEQEEDGKPRLYKHTTNNLELAADFNSIIEKQKILSFFDLMYQSHSNKGYKNRDRNLASNVQVLLNMFKSGVLVNYSNDGYTGNQELEGRIILSHYSDDYLNEVSDVKRKQAAYEMRNNNNYLPSLSPYVSYVPLIIPRGLELSASVGEKYGEISRGASLECYLYKKAGAGVDYEYTKKNGVRDEKVSLILKKAF